VRLWAFRIKLSQTPPEVIMAMDQLASLAGLFAVAFLRLLYIQFHHRQHQDTSPDKQPIPHQDEESQPLIAPPHVAQVALTSRGKLTCILAAIAYIAMTISGRFRMKDHVDFDADRRP
jgi:hypothetical protein